MQSRIEGICTSFVEFPPDPFLSYPFPRILSAFPSPAPRQPPRTSPPTRRPLRSLRAREEWESSANDRIRSLPTLRAPRPSRRTSPSESALLHRSKGRELTPRGRRSGKVSAGELGFSSTASPNSRLLALSLEEPPSAAPLNRTLSSKSSTPKSSNPPSRGNSVASKPLPAVVPARSASPDSVSEDSEPEQDQELEDDDDSESEDSESAESESEEEEVVVKKVTKTAVKSKLQNGDAAYSKPTANGRHGEKKKHHVRLAEEGRAAKPEHRTKLNKPLHTLTYDDVALTETDLRADIKETRNALYVPLPSLR